MDRDYTYAEIDRRVVRSVLQQFTSAQTAAQLASFGYDKEMVREVFREELRRKLAAVSAGGAEHG